MHRLLLALALAAAIAVIADSSASASPSGVVISKLRTRTAASQYDEFVQLTNTSGSAIDVSGWQLYDCYTSSGANRIGTDGDPLPSGTKLPAGATFVIGKDAGDYKGVADATYHYQVAETGGFQLRDKGGAVQDGVGAPGTACAEGAGLTFPTSGSDYDFTRTQDTDNNAADFSGPSGSANGTPCGDACAAPPAPTAIDAIQGSGSTSPLVGKKVQITGTVIGVDNQQGVSNYVNLDPRQAGIYVETPTVSQDHDTTTSEGIFVGGLGAADRAASHIGQTVTVSGKVTELYNLTTLDASGATPSFSGTAKQANLPAAVTIDPASAAAQTVGSDGTRPYFESLEGMRVQLATGTANSGGTDKFGELFLQPGTKRQRIFRNASQPAGPADLLDLTQDAGSSDVDPTNPSATPASSTRVNADLFDRVSNAVGPLGFDFSEYGIVVQPGAKPAVAKGPTAYPPVAPPAQPNTLRVANFNMENLFAPGMVDDGHTFTAAEIDAKTTRIANAIKLLNKPDVIAAEEVASGDSLAQVASKLGNYTSIWLPSNDARHVAVGFLVKKGVQVTDTEQLGKTATTSQTGCNDDASSNPQLFERPPLQITVVKQHDAFTLIGNHWASQGHPESCRQAQADFVAGQAAHLEALGIRTIVLGDLNDYEDSPALTQNLVAGNTLANQWSKAPAQDRYSFQYEGQLQTLDHLFVTKAVKPLVQGLEYVHFDNDYYERNETTAPTKVSDHDPPVLTLSLP
jgi:uncharacterized protein